jgi:Homeodomain-like domain
MRNAKGPTELGFTRYDRQRLKKAVHGVTEARDFRRLQAVLLVAQGRSIAEVAQITCASERSVYGWVRR